MSGLSLALADADLVIDFNGPGWPMHQALTLPGWHRPDMTLALAGLNDPVLSCHSPGSRRGGGLWSRLAQAPGRTESWPSLVRPWSSMRWHGLAWYWPGLVPGPG